ncbi:MAG: GtrA family protein [Pedobacter sp.]|nr:GtrA family protein [Pedobacter sp.]MDQ8051987.1 GtrA family protein [Pedobacter sp.]
MNAFRTYLLRFIDFFYPPFRRIIGLQTFRYLVCGGSNALLNLIVFSFSYNVLFLHQEINLLGLTITRYIAAYMVALSISFPVGFCLNKFVVFQQSNLMGRTQLIRYGALAITNIFLDYSLLHLLIGYWKLWATPSQAFIIILLSLISYFYQTYFSFKTIRKK